MKVKYDNVMWNEYLSKRVVAKNDFRNNLQIEECVCENLEGERIVAKRILSFFLYLLLRVGWISTSLSAVYWAAVNRYVLSHTYTNITKITRYFCSYDDLYWYTG